MKLALGTVQFGLDYGAFNCVGKTPLADVRQMLTLASAAGVDMLDTACAYGNSEAVLGELAACRDFRIVTKTPALSGTDMSAQLRGFFAQSLIRLRAAAVHGLLLHRAEDLLGPDGEHIWRALEDLRDSGQVGRIGFSAYGPENAKAVLQRYPVQLIQLPLSVFDTRHLDSGVLDLCQSRQVEVHVRSVFLQGFALSQPSKVEGHLRQWRGLLERFRIRCDELGITPLEAALRYAMGLPQVSQVVVGANRPEQLSEIVASVQGPDLPLGAFADVACGNLDLIEPGRWK